MIYLIEIAEPQNGAGLFAWFNRALSGIIIAARRGWVPVVDMTKQAPLVSSEPVDGSVNPWEYYFEQPGGISLEDARNSQNVVLSSAYAPIGLPYLGLTFFNGIDGNIARTSGWVDKYVRFNKRTEEFLERSWRETAEKYGVAPDSRVLAVMSRGTDYSKLRPAGHAIQPSPDELIEAAKRLMAEHDLDRVYLNTEEMRVRERFEQAFGDRFFCFDATYYDDYTPTSRDDILILHIHEMTQKSRYELNLEYLRGVWGASRGSWLLAGMNSGVSGAIWLNKDRYEGKEIYYNGFYAPPLR